MIATPASVFAVDPPVTVSVVSLKFEPNNAEIRAPAGVVSSEIDVNVAVSVLATGASFNDVTVWLSTTLAELYGVVKPVAATLIVAAVLTVVEESMSVTVKVGADPFQ